MLRYASVRHTARSAPKKSPVCSSAELEGVESPCLPSPVSVLEPPSEPGRVSDSGRPKEQIGMEERRNCTARAWAAAPSIASGCLWLLRMASSTAILKTSAVLSLKATARGDMRMAPPFAKDPPAKGKWGGSPVSLYETPSMIRRSPFCAVPG
mmetsp:Transcript_26990/g.52961  ORF Transcript_26990/g.52961 Transcript_26990/m.52961 type:complete len:153 (-) Transcript_26990:158-616(-)